MWPYHDIEESVFESAKDLAEDILSKLGAVKTEIPSNHIVRTCDQEGHVIFERISHRPIWRYQNHYYRVDEMLYESAPWIVLEYAETDLDASDDAFSILEPFRYSLSEDEMRTAILDSMMDV